MIPSAGSRPHLVTIQQNEPTANDQAGVPIPNWQPVANCWVKIESLDGRQLMLAQQVVAEATHRITSGFYPGIVPSMQIVFGSRVFQIGSARDPDECRRSLVMLCKELVPPPTP